jgi:hypothetical protein
LLEGTNVSKVGTTRPFEILERRGLSDRLCRVMESFELEGAASSALLPSDV